MKKVKDPQLPKRPQNPFFQFCQEQRNRVQKDYLRQNEGLNLSKKELTKLLAQKWHQMGAEQKQVSACVQQVIEYGRCWLR